VHKASIMVVEDDAKMRDALCYILKKENYLVLGAKSGEDALRSLNKDSFDIVITDFKLPGIDGLDVIKAVKDSQPNASVIMITAYAAVDSAVAAMKAGAEDYIAKPFNVDQIRIAIKKILEKRELITEKELLKSQLKTKYRFDNIVGSSEAMVGVFKLINQVKDSKTTVLILGETGTGKELFARALHYDGVRANKTFLPVNCAALNENLLTSELFGYLKGSFTGAASDKRGMFEIAEGGTIFLDEIGDVNPAMQTTLLRVLENGEIQPVGSTEPKKVDVRVVAATNKNLKELVAQGKFREDLYYRLNVVAVELPPLRSRKEDIAPLVERFIEKYAAPLNKKFSGMSAEALKAVERYDWPGNVRELENAIERAVLLETSGVITAQSLPPNVRDYKKSEEDNAEEDATLKGVGRAHILEVLDRVDWNKTKAAEVLGINRTSLWRIMKRLGLDDKSGD